MFCVVSVFMTVDLADSGRPVNPLNQVLYSGPVWDNDRRMTLKRPNPPLAIAFMLTATAFIAGTMVLAKTIGTGVLGDPLHPLQVSHARFVFAFLAIGTATLVMRPRFTRPALPIHIGRTLFGWGGVTLMFAAVAFIPLPDATAISFLNPVFGMLLAIPLLGERVGPWRWTAAGLALLGAMILLRPGPETFQWACTARDGADFHQKAGRPRATFSDIADQQRAWPADRVNCRDPVLDHANVRPMGGTCGYRRSYGRCPDLFYQRNGAGGRQFRDALQLSDTDLCGDLRRAILPPSPRHHQLDGCRDHYWGCRAAGMA